LPELEDELEDELREPLENWLRVRERWRGPPKGPPPLTSFKLAESRRPLQAVNVKKAKKNSICNCRF